MSLQVLVAFVILVGPAAEASRDQAMDLCHYRSSADQAARDIAPG